MKLIQLLFVLIACITLTYAWDKDDYEIFDLVSDLEAAEGKGTTFYSHLNIDISASTSEINKAYRKKSLELHPDKNRGVKDIQARFARLGVISQILRSPEKRERYNFFYKNGVPKWRGTGYYYSRFRPTLSHTLIFLVFLTSLFHLLIMRLNYNRDSRRVNYFSRTALASAKAGQGKKEKIDEDLGRRVKVPMVEGNDMAGSLELIVLGDHVYIPHEDGSLEPLSDLATPPALSRMWPVKLSQSILRRALSFLPAQYHAQIPASIRPHPKVEETSEDTVEGYEVKPTRNNRKNRRDKSNTATPRDTPVTTDMESEDDGELIEAVEGDEAGNGETAEGKKKKRGVGKAGGARRRKMAMKK